MKNKRNTKQAIIVTILLISVVLTWFSSPTFSDIRNVDLIKIFIGGLLAGLLISALKEIYLERKAGKSSSE